MQEQKANYLCSVHSEGLFGERNYELFRVSQTAILNPPDKVIQLLAASKVKAGKSFCGN